ncbi:MAG: aldo/keto reductase [Meiothermus sp.]|nr:aldo/keto reductase [Meiothermus sp.]
MKVNRLGRTGLKVSEVCLGTMTFGGPADEATSFAIMDLADAAGVNFIDTADVYPLGAGLDRVGATEEIVGRWIKSRGARERIVLATKARGRMGPNPGDEGLSRKHLMKAVEDSLRRLQTDHIDLYQVHSPDPDTPIEETLGTLTEMVRRGYVRYIGCSNYPAWQLAEALWASDKRGLARFDSAQPRYNLLFRMIEDELVPLCRSQGVGIIAYNPLAGGMLTGRYKERIQAEGNRFAMTGGSGDLYRRRYWNEAVFAAVDALAKHLEPRGKSLTHAALAWVLAQPGVSSAIVGASRPEQLEDSLKALEMTLEPEELAVLGEAWYSLPKERDPAVARR